MVVELAPEPREIVNDIRARRRTVPGPPSMLTLPVGTQPLPPPVHEHQTVTEMHADWHRVHHRPRVPESAGRGLRGAVSNRIADVTRKTLEPDLRDDRMLVGDLIRATDVVARRCDDLAQRIAQLEAVVEEVVRVISADVTSLRAALVALVGDDEPEGGPGDSGPSGRSVPGSPSRDG